MSPLEWPPDDWPVGVLTDAAFMNQEIRDRQLFLYGAARGVGLYKTADTAATSEAFPVWDNELFDTDAMWAASPNPTRITVPAGYEGRINFFGCYAQAPVLNSSQVSAIFRLNGVIVAEIYGQVIPAQSNITQPADIASSFTYTDQASAGDYWEIGFRGASTAAWRGGRKHAVFAFLM